MILSMCFSVEIENDLKKLAEKFNAQVSLADVEHFNSLRQRAHDRDWVKKTFNLSRKPQANIIKLPEEDGRIYPGTFTFVMVNQDGARKLLPMRYRLRPKGSEAEIPTKFNVFNARLDSLENRSTWKPLFMKQHGLLPFKQFYEWVEDAQDKRLISFFSDRHEIMWAPCVWDYWENKNEGVGMYSFALITDEPPEEISQAGHDRCPIFLREDLIDGWLSPEGKSKSEIYRLLKNKQSVFYLNKFCS